MSHENKNVIRLKPRTAQEVGEVAAEHAGVMVNFPLNGNRQPEFSRFEHELPEIDFDPSSAISKMTPAEPMSAEEYAQQMSEAGHLQRQVQRGGTPFAK